MDDEGIVSMYNAPFKKMDGIYLGVCLGRAQEKYWNSLIRRVCGPASTQSRPIRACPSAAARQQLLQSFYLSEYESRQRAVLGCAEKNLFWSWTGSVGLFSCLFLSALVKLSHLTQSSSTTTTKKKMPQTGSQQHGRAKCSFSCI